MDGLAAVLSSAGLPAQVIGMPVLFDVIFATGEISDYRSTLRQDVEAMRRFNRSLRGAGVLKGDSKFYVSTVHTEADVQHALAAFRVAVDAEVGFRG
jgi:glutamate-1-semialdehyde 2,1-aminomutase